MDNKYHITISQYDYKGANTEQNQNTADGKIDNEEYKEALWDVYQKGGIKYLKKGKAVQNENNSVFNFQVRQIIDSIKLTGDIADDKALNKQLKSDLNLIKDKLYEIVQNQQSAEDPFNRHPSTPIPQKGLADKVGDLIRIINLKK